MPREDIERLQQKIEKDPDSKLFVPLAEEYKKAGMVDEAINILVQGIEKQPNYLSARVSLAKIYIGKGLLNEAKDEFQKVIAIIPDNLYAHKKLAEIYRELGERADTIHELNIVLNLNPADEWAVSTLSAIEKESQQKPEEPPIPALPESPEITEIGEHVYPDREQNITPVEEAHESPSMAGEEEVQQIPLHAAPAGKPEEVFEELKDEEEQAISLPEEVRELWAEHPPLHNPVLDAENFIKQGNYNAAMNIYKTTLSEDPENRQLLQRIAELKALLKMLGKGQEAHILKLEGFLEGIKKRRNEFLASTEETGGNSG